MLSYDEKYQPRTKGTCFFPYFDTQIQHVFPLNTQVQQISKKKIMTWAADPVTLNSAS